jgi:glycosyltransferase involved in cell wall biosynthesis
MTEVRPRAVICSEAISAELEHFFVDRRIRLIRLRSRNSWRSALPGICRAAWLLTKFPLTTVFVVWAHHSDSNRWLQLVLALLGRRPILIERALTPTPESLSHSRLTKPIKQVVARFAKQIILCGDNQRREYQETFGITDKKIQVIRNTRRISEIAQRVEGLRRDLSQLRTKLHIENVPTVVSIGRLDVNKRHDVLISATALLNQQTSAALIIVGDGPEMENLRLLSEKVAPGLVTFAGHQKDAVPWLAAADVFGLVSVGEGLSGALIEAMAAGLPCVVTNIPGNTELICDGVTGLTVPVGDASATSAAIAMFLKDRDLATETAKAARELVATHYDEGHERSGWEGLLRSLYD